MAEISSLREIAASVRSRKSLAVDHVEYALSRCEASQNSLNAFTYIDRDRALRAAAAIDAEIAAGKTVGSLAGVPVAIKDIIDHKGWPNSYGSGQPAVFPSRSATCISRLEAAGAVIVGRTGLHEFAFGFSSENHWHGAVRNPWDLRCSPGGSSGGSASAVAAGLVPVSLGTDTGGSVRVPAALCGIVGLKVTHGRVPLRGVFPLASPLDTVGPLGRSVTDVAAVYEAIAGDDPRDPWSVPRKVDKIGPPADLKNITIGIPDPWGSRPVVPEQRIAFDAWIEALRVAGVDVLHIDIPELGPSQLIQDGIYFEAAHVHRERWQQDPNQYGPEVRDRIKMAMQVTSGQYLKALESRRATRAATLRAFQTVDVLATPTVASLQKRIGNTEVDVLGEKVPYAKAKSMFTNMVNHIGFPALALPLSGISLPPPSVQLIGKEWSETRLLEIGMAMEKEGLTVTQQPPYWQPEQIDYDPAKNE